MELPPNPVEEVDESIKPREEGLPDSDFSESVNSENQALVKPNETLLKIAQDMARILDGLHESIKKYIEPATTLQQVTFFQLVQDAMKVEKSEISNQEGSQKKKGKRARESQVEPAYCSATRGRRQGSNKTQGSGRGTSTGQEERYTCPHFHRNHYGLCRLVTGGCFRCGSTEHMMINCPRGSGSSRNPQGNSRGGSNVPPQTHNRDRGRSGAQGRGSASGTVNCPATTAPAQASDMEALKE